MRTSTPCCHEPAPTPGAKRLRVAVIGLGVGEAHLAGYRAHPACDVVALCDFSKEKLQEASRTHGDIDCRASADDILDDPDIDVVSIASYDNYHHGQAVRALTNNKHVFIEKPLCLWEEEARHIRAQLTARPHLRLSSNLILRLCPRFMAVRERIRRGEFGELFLVEGDYHYGRLHKITDGWRGLIDYYSVVHGGAIHLVDLLLWMTGDRIVEVSAVGNQVSSRGSRFRFNDTVIATIRFERGMVGKVGVSYGCVRPHYHGLAIYGTKATFVNGHPHGLLYESRDPAQRPTTVTDPYPGVQKGGLIAGFIDSILHDREPVVGIEDTFRTMSVCLAIEQSVARGTPCRVEYL